MVAAVRRGTSLRSAAGQWGVPLSTVQYWKSRAGVKRLDRVDWDDRSKAPQHSRRTKPTLERRILATRKRLKERSDLGEYGAVAIHRDLQNQGVKRLPSIRTIGRIVERHGMLDGRKRIRRPPPPPAWYLPDVADVNCELDAFDTIEGLAIRGGPYLSILTGISQHGGLAAAWPEPRITAPFVVDALLEHWREFGLPAYAQFDNDNRFIGPRQCPDAIGRVIRTCLSLQVTPVFTVPNETGFQASMESFNGRWQAKVWSRFTYSHLKELQDQSRKYITAVHQRHAARIEAAPTRKPFPSSWRLNLQERPSGRIIFLRRTNGKGHTNILGHSFSVDSFWTHRLVRAEVDLDSNTIHFYALRRREPTEQPLLSTHPYKLPNKKFRE
jgi:hypothetical protein